MSEYDTQAQVTEAQQAALRLANVDEETRNGALQSIADAIRDSEAAILEANAKDVEEAEEMLAQGEYTQALVDRLKLDSGKLESIAEMVESVAEQDDPLGETLEARQLDDDLELYKVAVPIGVVGTIFESRPDALVQIAALSLKSGNSVILKGGSEASESNRILYETIVQATAEAIDAMPEGWAQLIEAHEEVDRLLEMDDKVDLLMPRGSSEFVSYIQDNTQIPVLGHTEGICHVYVDEAADLEMAEDIAFDAKVQYPAVCNAVETLLVSEAVAEQYLPGMVERYEDAGVTLRGDEQTREVVDVDPATEADWDTEYGDLELSIKVVGDVYEAVEHVNTHGSKHTESIVTEDGDAAETFMTGIDAASVFHNASTRFADGYRYGLGAEVGISTGKIHARGPVGLAGLTTYKYYLEGDGQLVATYAGDDAKPFTHVDFDGQWTPGQLSER
ncbi:glutamate-5-semialdehyde dehydrogenase [Halapricum hydrolyticum]|uniref:Gamma-glutamyl phosphate reductase n=1 Tax=Halapricum hydrolyticum TaxID=2979991 RepID=A0AAE3I9Z1_9EURY|nr:glutamate-5-semialdehyde dehydrogenase [Halapricum hydrolyticum]MCU4717275.1 glutamate-5-semialdehyde dehydrogenase [Halapricum hydrolyticum]MCU4726202.1 glutamate-5-semialdehyde dehydrogenase [Halapricum hydrolyticum]